MLPTVFLLATALLSAQALPNPSSSSGREIDTLQTRQFAGLEESHVVNTNTTTPSANVTLLQAPKAETGTASPGTPTKEGETKGPSNPVPQKDTETKSDKEDLDMAAKEFNDEAMEEMAEDAQERAAEEAEEREEQAQEMREEKEEMEMEKKEEAEDAKEDGKNGMGSSNSMNGMQLGSKNGAAQAKPLPPML
ncbi:hypothetical protein FKW77_002492 [Venturia effusa]|uniref:Uncharacterized protein n=1 Tax=Venturia effusa TaxID=50376 RepID=A0A517LNH9_9PEZI|nr:hypothetical protein FKW77_002492 [Venturia effusa]